MDNRESAAQLVRLGLLALRKGDGEKAKRCIQRAERMCPDVEGLQQAKASLSGAGSTSPSATGSAEATAKRVKETLRQRRQTSTGTTNTTRPFTPEQEQAAKAVIRCKSHYDVLGIDKGSSDSVVKKAYRKLALKFHPDKNTAPGAEEAFKKISHAFAVLSDSKQRQNYDEYGHEDGAQPQAHAGGGGVYHGQHMTPEDLFRQFFADDAHFGRGGPQFRFYRGGAGHAHGDDGTQGNRVAHLVQLLPLLMLVLLTLMSYGSPDSSNGSSVFSLQRHGSFVTHRTTSSEGVVRDIDYWVRKDFRQQVGRGARALRQVEQSVEQSYYSMLKRNCQTERQQQRQMEVQARTAYGPRRQALMKQALEFAMPGCQKLNEVFGG